MGIQPKMLDPYPESMNPDSKHLLLEKTSSQREKKFNALILVKTYLELETRLA